MLYGLHGAVPLLLVLSDTGIAVKCVASMLAAVSFYGCRRAVRKLAQVSQLRLDNQHCSVRIAGELQRCACDMDRVVTGLFVGLSLQPLGSKLQPLGSKLQPPGGKLKPLYLPIFFDSVSRSDLRLLRAFLRCT